MSKHGSVQAVQPIPAGLGQVKDVMATLVQSMPNLTNDDASFIISAKRTFIKDVRRVFHKYQISSGLHQTLLSWVEFYQFEFGIKLNLERLLVPNRHGDYTRLIVIPHELTVVAAYEKCVKYLGAPQINPHFINDGVEWGHDRIIYDAPYAVWVRDSPGPDPEYFYQSYIALKSQRIEVITLLERLVFGLKYWKETGLHLDTNTSTLCAGSVFSSAQRSERQEKICPAVHSVYSGGEFVMRIEGRVDWAGSQNHSTRLVLTDNLIDRL